MNRTDKIHAALGILAALAALVWLLVPDGDGPDDPAAPVVVVETVVTCEADEVLAPFGEVCIPRPPLAEALAEPEATGAPPEPEPEPEPTVSRLTPPEPEPVVVGDHPNLDRPVIEYYEDGSWRNHTTGESGCTPGALCDEPLVTVMPDGTWTTPDGMTGCLDGYPCAP